MFYTNLPNRQSPALSQGFTLIELLIVLLIVGIVLLFAVPSLQTNMQNGQLASARSNWLSALSNARTEAVSRSTAVSLCASSDQASCAGNGNWEAGWIAFVDDGKGGGTAEDRDRHADEDLIAVGHALPASLTMRAKVYPDLTAVMYESNGMTSARGSWVICDSRGAEWAKVINVNIAGQPSLAFDTNTDGTLEDVSGAEVTSCP